MGVAWWRVVNRVIRLVVRYSRPCLRIAWLLGKESDSAFEKGGCSGNRFSGELVQRTDSVFRMVLSFPFLPTIVVGREKRANR